MWVIDYILDYLATTSLYIPSNASDDTESVNHGRFTWIKSRSQLCLTNGHNYSQTPPVPLGPFHPPSSRQQQQPNDIGHMIDEIMRHPTGLMAPQTEFHKGRKKPSLCIFPDLAFSPGCWSKGSTNHQHDYHLIATNAPSGSVNWMSEPGRGMQSREKRKSDEYQ